MNKELIKLTIQQTSILNRIFKSIPIIFFANSKNSLEFRNKLRSQAYKMVLKMDSNIIYGVIAKMFKLGNKKIPKLKDRDNFLEGKF